MATKVSFGVDTVEGEEGEEFVPVIDFELQNGTNICFTANIVFGKEEDAASFIKSVADTFKEAPRKWDSYPEGKLREPNEDMN